MQKIPELTVIAASVKTDTERKKGINYERVAFELDMSRSAYWLLESGENFSLKTLVKICKFLE